MNICFAMILTNHMKCSCGAWQYRVGAWAWQFTVDMSWSLSLTIWSTSRDFIFSPGCAHFYPVLEKLNVAMKSLNYASAGSADTGSRGRDIYNSIWWDRSEPRGEYVGIILIKLWSFNTQLRFERHTCVHKLFLNMWGEQNHNRIVSFLLPNQTSCLVKISSPHTFFCMYSLEPLISELLIEYDYVLKLSDFLFS